MTISITTATVSVVGDGATTVFTYPFLIPYQADGATPASEVFVTDATTGAITTAVLGSDYSISGVGVTTGGAVTWLDTVLATTQTITIQRALAYDQPIAVGNNDFLPNTVEVSADRTVEQVQQLAAQLALCFALSPSESPFVLPGPGGRANTVLGFDASGNPTLVPYGSL